MKTIEDFLIQEISDVEIAELESKGADANRKNMCFIGGMAAVQRIKKGPANMFGLCQIIC